MVKTFPLIAIVLLAPLVTDQSLAQDEFEIVTVPAGEGAAQKIVDGITSMGPQGRKRFNISFGPDRAIRVPLEELIFGNADEAIKVSDDQEVELVAAPEVLASGQQINIDGDGLGARFAALFDNATIRSLGITYSNFDSPGDGGVFAVHDDATLDMFRSQILANTAAGYGGGIFANDNAHLVFIESQFYNNTSGLGGGAVALLVNSTAQVSRCILSGNQSGGPGRDLYLDSTGSISPFTGLPLYLEGCQVAGATGSGASIHSENGNTMGVIFNVVTKSGSSGFQGSGVMTHFGSNSWDEDSSGFQLQVDSGVSKPFVQCDDSDGDNFVSLGFNITSDDSCNLDQSTDLPNTDPMLAANAFGIYEPQPGSPAIDSGGTGAFLLPGDNLETLPCGYKDLMGLGRPQDANNDGVFECDRGAVEVAGPGALSPGHSAAFFNFLRDGEGQYVEMLNANTAIVYTFTHRPDGSGPMWFIGVGYVSGNSIVIDQLLRPIGTSFGDDFDSGEIVNTFAGGQSMVFNDCEASGSGGNVAFSGNRDIGLEALITRAGRLSNILGCGSITPHPNAGLSGSYFLPARDGEGIVVQWLPNGQVLVIFFTYDLNNNQQWVLGIGQSDGFSVTMDAVYASGNTTWGSDYDANDVVLSPWGTFELNWSECGGVQFGYNSTVAGYGAATREYIRLSSLWEASCPDF